jgi:hypothetical protein
VQLHAGRLADGLGKGIGEHRVVFDEGDLDR